MQLVWHRGDLRTHDHPALTAATTAGEVVGVVVLDPHILAAASPRRRAWFVANVWALRAAYAALGGTLLVRTGEPWTVLPALRAQLPAPDVHALRSHTPYGRERDRRTEAALGGITWHDGRYLRPPGSVRAPECRGQKSCVSRANCERPPWRCGLQASGMHAECPRNGRPKG